MSTSRKTAILQWTTIGSLLLVVVGIPATQAVHELSTTGRAHIVSLYTHAPTKENLHGWDLQARDNSIFGSSIRPRVLQWQYDLFGDMGPKAIEGRNGWLFYRPDVDYLARPGFQDERFYLGSFDTTIAGKRENLRNPLVAIRDVHRQLAARGIRLVVVPVPGKPTIYPEKLAGFEVGIKHSPTLDLIDSLQASGIGVVDLVRPLRASKLGAKTDLYLRRDTHWSPAGLAVAAEIIARKLLDFPEIASRRDSRRYVARDTLIERWGDICEMSALPRRRGIWKTESVHASRVFDSTGSPYADSDSGAILWLGDSYSRIYQTDAPKAAGIIAQVALRTGQPIASVVNDGGASTVVRRKLLQKPGVFRHAKVVVWEFVERDIRFGADGWALEKLPR